MVMKKSIQSLAINQNGTLLVRCIRGSDAQTLELGYKRIRAFIQGQEEDRKEFTSVTFSTDDALLISAGS